MVRDVTDTLDRESESDGLGLLRTFVGRVRAWQEFMRKGTQSLSAEAEIGLVGELSVLAAIIGAGIQPSVAIEGWMGPLDRVQDFVLGTGALEVKATLAASGFPAWIGSLEQLDDAIRQPLFVAATKFHQSTAGRSLPEIVAKFEESIQGDARAERHFSDRILAAGYFRAHSDRYSRRFELASLRILEVTKDFPRLTSSTVPGGIRKAMYQIDIDQIPDQGISLGQALMKLGVA
jgi:hypothetical protein